LLEASARNIRMRGKVKNRDLGGKDFVTSDFDPNLFFNVLEEDNQKKKNYFKEQKKMLLDFLSNGILKNINISVGSLFNMV
jgi:hypothetical protein